MMEQNDRYVKLDRMRYTKDSFSSNMALLGIVFNVLYFISIYKSDVSNYYYTWMIGASVIYNLLFLLTAFLASQGVKNRKYDYWLVLYLIGLMQIIRILYLPTKAHTTMVTVSGVERLVMRDGQYLFVTCCLIASAVCCVLGAVCSCRNCVLLDRHMSRIEKRSA